MVDRTEGVRIGFVDYGTRWKIAFAVDGGTDEVILRVWVKVNVRG